MELDGRIVGTTSFWYPEHEASSMEIGSTWLHPDCWGTGANGEAEMLLLEHAFADLDCERITLRTDPRNLRSQRAIEKLGAVRYRVVERDMRRADGSWRGGVYYRVAGLRSARRTSTRTGARVGWGLR